jgi:hypothetical protein
MNSATAITGERPTRVFEESKRCPGFPAYSISESGRVSRIGHPGYRKQQITKRGGYVAVSLWSNSKGHLKTVHRLVALAFIGPQPSPKHEVAHNDGNKRNNHWSNLRWATRKENEADKVLHGRSNRGERNGMAKLTDSQAAEIISRLASGESAKSIAKDFPIVSVNAIYVIKMRAKKCGRLI